MLLLQSKLDLLCTLIEPEAAHDVIPTDCLRISVANRLIQYAKDSLSEGAASTSDSIACMCPVRTAFEPCTSYNNASPLGIIPMRTRRGRSRKTHAFSWLLPCLLRKPHKQISSPASVR